MDKDMLDAMEAGLDRAWDRGALTDAQYSEGYTLILTLRKELV